MKRNSIGVVLLAALSFMLTAGAQAQAMEEADVPFAFHAGSAELPAGHYLIKEDHIRHSIRICNGQTGAVAVLSVQQSSAGTERRILLFHRVGGEHYLREVRGSEDALNLTIAATRREKQAAALQIAESASPAGRLVTIALK